MAASDVDVIMVDSDLDVTRSGEQEEQHHQPTQPPLQQDTIVVALNCGKHGLTACAVQADLGVKKAQRQYMVWGFELMKDAGYNSRNAQVLPGMVGRCQVLQAAMAQQPNAYVVLLRHPGYPDANKYTLEALERKQQHVDTIAAAVAQRYPQAQQLDITTRSINTAAKAFTGINAKQAAEQAVAGNDPATLQEARTAGTPARARAKIRCNQGLADAAVAFLSSSSCSMVDPSADAAEQLQAFAKPVDTFRDMAATLWMAMYVLHMKPTTLMRLAAQQGRAAPGRSAAGAGTSGAAGAGGTQGGAAAAATGDAALAAAMEMLQEARRLAAEVNCRLGAPATPAGGGAARRAAAPATAAAQAAPCIVIDHGPDDLEWLATTTPVAAAAAAAAAGSPDAPGGSCQQCKRHVAAVASEQTPTSNSQQARPTGQEPQPPSKKRARRLDFDAAADSGGDNLLRRRATNSSAVQQPGASAEAAAAAAAAAGGGGGVVQALNHHYIDLVSDSE